MMNPLFPLQESPKQRSEWHCSAVSVFLPLSKASVPTTSKQQQPSAKFSQRYNKSATQKSSNAPSLTANVSLLKFPSSMLPCNSFYPSHDDLLGTTMCTQIYMYGITAESSSNPNKLSEGEYQIQKIVTIYSRNWYIIDMSSRYYRNGNLARLEKTSRDLLATDLVFTRFDLVA